MITLNDTGCILIARRLSAMLKYCVTTRNEVKERGKRVTAQQERTYTPIATDKMTSYDGSSSSVVSSR